MIVFNTDLDNTIIYSYKCDIGPDKRSVEYYQGREISFITGKTYDLLKRVKEEMLIVPTTTRTIEQYERIHLGIGPIKYALVCNGGILLVDGKRDESWYNASLGSIAESSGEIEKALNILGGDKRRKYGLRYIEKLFVFTKCSEPQEVVKELRVSLDTGLVDVFHHGEKVYVVPVHLNKGRAVTRFKEYAAAGYIIAAGDSEFDISLLDAADMGLAPYGFKAEYGVNINVKEAGNSGLFSEYVLEECLKICQTVSLHL